ncbi:MAG: hypothetical protein ACK5JT_17340 [Hyphomicrobiaceae bacterium]
MDAMILKPHCHQWQIQEQAGTPGLGPGQRKDGQFMSLMAWILLGAMLVFDTVSHLLLKASTAIAEKDQRDMLYLRRLFRVPIFWIAIASFMGMMVAWIGFYSRVPLAQGVMTGCITIAGVMIGGRIFFGEKLTPARATAAALIAVGVVLVGWDQT